MKENPPPTGYMPAGMRVNGAGIIHDSAVGAPTKAKAGA